MSINENANIVAVVDNVPIDYLLVISILVYFEISALKRNYYRWLPNEYNHQFDTNIGIANLKPEYENGNFLAFFDAIALGCMTLQNENLHFKLDELGEAKIEIISHQGHRIKMMNELCFDTFVFYDSVEELDQTMFQGYDIFV
jgi:hypothetical protein